MNVLLVIDMQKSVFAAPRLNTKEVVENINLLADFMRRSGGLVIFIQHNGSQEDDLVEATVGWEIIDELNFKVEDLRLTKTACDSFYRTELESILRGNKATNIVIVGAVTEYCVDTTLRSCLSKEFNVTAISDAHTTGNRTHLPAKDIVLHHNQTWKNLILPSVDIQVVTTSEFLNNSTRFIK
ncbi:MAG: isochorismatase family protein [Gammaproteobacteria bacterium]|nr:isochorismatase family protein [Gammaproteobacteria bacterium]MBU2058178.1 isochorismatase family protein [Gammaproteobacteria bacterium]MBU2176913.1 isochorismatase family protein [Gammaproteobacteria bacterium]MBU2246046.1 isochorismatase family protein [Gammaproteobacteria bacterium]MBU2344117.1 isochorismatase family protein [Gammaproteobacteria bacterium]